MSGKKKFKDTAVGSFLLQKIPKVVGAIAQEIQEVLPDTVVQTTHGVYSVNPDNITWYLVNAVQELSRMENPFYLLRP